MEETKDKYRHQKKYHEEHYYRYNIVIPKEMRPLIDEAAKAAGMSKNAWLKEAIETKLAESK